MIWRIDVAVAFQFAVVAPVAAQDVPVEPGGAITFTFPALTVPNSDLMSAEGNRSRVEHVLTERGLKGRLIEELNAALFGPRLELMKAAYPDVSIREDRIAGVRVFIYEPKGAPLKPRNKRLLINVHGGCFVGCFTACGGVEAIPIAA